MLFFLTLLPAAHASGFLCPLQDWELLASPFVSVQKNDGLGNFSDSGMR